MLKYSLILFIVSYCDSRGRVGDYKQLVLTLHAPASSFYWQHFRHGHHDVNVNTFQEHFSTHGIMLESNRWIIHGLWATDKDNEILLFCTTDSGKIPLYQRLDPFDRQTMKKKWPILIPRRTEESIWENEFNMCGCCITEVSWSYFTMAMRLVDRFPIGEILANSTIFPENISYKLEAIEAAISSALQKLAYVECLRVQNGEDQYLLQVQLCLDRLENLVDCRHKRNYLAGSYECNRTNLVIFPDIPTA